MLKRVKVLAYLAGGSLLGILGGCGYDLALDAIPRVVIAVLNEDIFG